MKQPTVGHVYWLGCFHHGPFQLFLELNYKGFSICIFTFYLCAIEKFIGKSYQKLQN